MDTPFLNKKGSLEFNKSLNDFILVTNEKRMSHMLSTENMYTIHHGNSFSSIENSKSAMTKHSVEIKYDLEDVKNYKIEKFYQFISEFIEKMNSQMIKSIYHTLSDSCNKTGNTVDASQKQMSNTEAFLEMIKKVEFGVDKNGKVSIPAIHMHPNHASKFVEELKAEGEEFNQLVEKIQKEKTEQALKKEKDRLLKFEGINYE